MKKIILAIFFLSLGLFLQSQTIKLYTQNNILINSGDTITIDSLSSVDEMIIAIKVKNITTDSIGVTCKKQYVYIVSGTTNTFCWGGCLPDYTMASLAEIKIGPGDTCTEFSGYYKPNNLSGTSIIKYLFRSTLGEIFEVNVKYTGTTSISENNYSNSISAPFPNPAKSITSINYNLNAKAYFQIYNISGLIVKQVYLTDRLGVINLDVSTISSGIYLCSLNINGTVVKTSKLIIYR